MKRLYRQLSTYFSVLVIGGTFLWAALTVYFTQGEKLPDGVIEIRLSHWQLEAGVRDAFNKMAKEYQELHPNVRIRQEAIPDGVYGQWMTTQLIGGTAPDIMQVGAGLPRPVLVSYMNRYFVPLTRYVSRPDPYNKDTDLESEPVRLTFTDDMLSGYWAELQEYMLMPLANFGVRIFYNKDLYTKLTGRTDPPKDYRDFLAACEEIKRHNDAKGRPYIPIASSKWHMIHWEDNMFDPMTYSILYTADMTRDGFVGNDEFYVALRSGILKWSDPALRLRYQMVHEVANEFETGFTGLTRDEAVFLFAQQRAVFITTGTWDALSLKEQARGTFEVGLMNFPAPTPDDPVYGKLILGPYYQLPTTGFLFGVTRTSKHFDAALDFLMFLASRSGNELLNETIGWIPSIKGAKVSSLLRDFRPSLEGMFPCASLMQIAMGGESQIKYQQLYSLFQVNQISYEDMTKQYTDYYMTQGVSDWNETQKDWRRNLSNDSTLIAGVRAKAMQTEGEISRSNWIKYRNLMRDRELIAEVGHHGAADFLNSKLSPDTVGPYEYSKAVMAEIRKNVKAEMEEERRSGADATEKTQAGN